MNIAQAKQEIENTVLAYTRKREDGSYVIPTVHQRPVLLIGPPGIGKTAIMEQIARECRIGLVAYTITHHTRQSAIGLPVIEKRKFGDREYTVTEYTMSEIVASVYRCMENTGCQEGILFIDEINCVSETLAPTMLQFLQCKTFGSHTIPRGWVIVAAGNPSRYNKSVREFDIVTLDRIKRLDVTEDYNAWKSYARENGCHPFILAYLDMKQENFYRVEACAEGSYFVTARGWEDLSRMIYVYEDMGIPVNGEFVFQYLQHPDTAKDFAGFYDLCRTYGEDYDMMAILEGRMEEESLQEKAFCLQCAGCEERLAAESLLVSALHEVCAGYAASMEQVQSCYDEAVRLKSLLSECKEEDVSALLEQEIEKRNKALLVKKDAGLCSEESAHKEQMVTDWVRSFSYEWRKRCRESGISPDSLLREYFGKEKEKLEEKKRKTADSLERAFAFAGKAFLEGQEMALFTEEVTGDKTVMGFIVKNGCEAYLKNAGILQTSRREEELHEEIRSLSDSLQIS